MIGRRTFLALGAAGLGLATVGAAMVARGYDSWVRATLRRVLPGHSFNAAGLDRFVDEYGSTHADALKFRLFGVADSILDAKSLLPEKKVHYIEDEERDLLTEFLIGSDFFQRAPDNASEITYSGRPVGCRSPFAVFDL